MSKTRSVHIVIPDTQVKPGVPVDNLRWIGQFIVDKYAQQPNITVVHLGDHWDMPSLSSYDVGKKSMEGRRVVEDIEAGNRGMDVLNEPLDTYNALRKARKEKQWSPRRVLLRGNHEDRISRAVEHDPQMEGFLSLDLLKSPGWEVYGFLEPVEIDGVTYSHYFYNPNTGRPYGGTTALMLKTVGHSFTQGHRQTLDYTIRFVKGRSQHGLIAGASYLHTEKYLGPQGNEHWRGIVVCHDVRNGSYDPMFISLDYLCRRYEGVELDEFLGRNLAHAA